MAVYNNYVHDFGFAGIRCGDRISEVFGCALTDISQNLVVAKGVNVTGNVDATGLYWNTHWYAPGEWEALSGMVTVLLRWRAGSLGSRFQPAQ